MLQTVADETITILSERYGELHLTSRQVFAFEKGIVGFQEIKEYGLVALEDTPFFILHATSAQLSFILIPAEKVVIDYSFKIDQETIDLLGIQRPEDVVIFLIVNIIDDQFYVNLKAPVLIAPNQQTGCQFVIHDQDYPIRHPLKPSKEAV